MFGRVLDLTISNKNLSQRHIENCGINWPIQGSAAEAWKRILNRICDESVPVDDLRSQIHDEAWVNNIYKLPDDIEHTLPFWTPIKITEVHDYAQPY
jgi:DNA polymerase I-like protein with 3'-5' exonuclease and polymerase domains